MTPRVCRHCGEPVTRETVETVRAGAPGPAGQ